MAEISLPMQAGDRLALTGATGILGSEVAKLVDIRGIWRRRELVRGPTPKQTLHDPFIGDLSMRDFRPFLQGCQGLVHAAFAHIPGRYRGGEGDDPERFWDLNITATVRLLEQAREVGVRRVVLFSSRAVYGVDAFGPGQQIDETYPPQPDTHYGLQKATLEGLARLYSDTRMTVAVLRPTGIYGGFETPTLKWRGMFVDAAQGVFPSENRTSTEVNAQTVAKASAFLLSTPHPEISGAVFNLSEVRVSQSQILTAAGFDVSAMPPPVSLSGPELIPDAVHRLGVPKLGMAALHEAAVLLRKHLDL